MGRRNWALILRRIVRHSWRDDAQVQKAIPPAAAQRLQQLVSASELHHTGEIRIYVESGLPISYLLRDASARERALAIFGKLRVWDTEKNTGVLIYLLLADHAIEIVADRGIDRCVSSSHWQLVVARLAASLREHRFEEGLSQAVKEVSALLVEHFPAFEGEINVNELADEPVLGRSDKEI